MEILLDTHAFIWYINAKPELSKKAFSFIDDVSNNAFISIASIWEMSIKIKLGKLKLISDFNDIKSELKKFDIKILNLDIEDILMNFILEFHHRDPFDRIIIAQSLNNNIPKIGKDEIFDKYGVKRIW